MIDVINNLFSHVEIQELNLKNKDKDFFIEIINKLKFTADTNLNLYFSAGIDLHIYSEMFYEIIDKFLEEKYGEFQTDLIIWYCTAGFDDQGNPLPFTYKLSEDSDEVTVYIKDSEMLYDTLQKLPKEGNLYLYDPNEEDEDDEKDDN